MFKIGIDVGGTFTDFVVAKDSKSPRYFKTSSTPADPSEGVMTGLSQVADAFALSLKDLLAATGLIIHETRAGPLQKARGAGGAGVWPDEGGTGVPAVQETGARG